jgi:hypothetical protein
MLGPKKKRIVIGEEVTKRKMYDAVDMRAEPRESPEGEVKVRGHIRSAPPKEKHGVFSGLSRRKEKSPTAKAEAFVESQQGRE